MASDEINRATAELIVHRLLDLRAPCIGDVETDNGYLG
jgi:hypothetical protein